MAPTGAQASEPAAAIVTNCRSFAASGAQGAGLLTALGDSTLVTFACDPMLSGGPGPYSIPVTSTIAIAKRVTIDGSDSGAHDVTLSGGGAQQIFKVLPSAALTLSQLTIAQGNSAEGTGFGGAIETDGDLTVIDSTFVGNQSNHLGGAIDIASNRPSSSLRVVIAGTTFVNNAATSYGGAIEADATGALVSVTNSTFVGNSSGEGGAIRNGVARVTIANSTFSANAAANGGALSNSASLTIRNSILANNPDPCSGFAVITDGGNNLEYPQQMATYCGFSTARGDIFADPLLGALADNGGPVRTALPAPGSPAIDAGNPTGCIDAGHALTVDQRGFSRPYPAGGRCDIGAVEVQPRTTLTLVSSANPADIGQPLTITATVILSATAQQPPSGTVDFALVAPTSIRASLGSANLSVQEQAVITATGQLFSQPGSYTLSAVYSGDNHIPPISASQPLPVRPCTVSVGMRASDGRLVIRATTAITPTAYRVDFTAPTGSFTLRDAAVTACGGGSAGLATASLAGIASAAGGVFAPGDLVSVRLIGGANAAAAIGDARTRLHLALSGPFGAGSFLRIAG